MALINTTTLSEAGGIDIKLSGFDVLAKQLREMPEKLAKKEVVAALREAGRPVLKAAKAAAPVAARATNRVNPGLLKRSIKLWARRGTRGDHPLNRAIRIGVKRPNKKQQRGVEATQRAVRRSTGVDLHKYFFDPYYWYFLERGTSKMAARPFLAPAFNAHKNSFTSDFKKTMGARIEKYWRSLK